ncbi:MAG: CAP domain-containing protein [Chloroflexi bacterium]|nr:CAP domain-containing protein [Chloroflexota bacterium]
MLELINAERRKVDIDPVVLGENTAAQLHAESSLENCVLSHWGVDGLKPYMRYSLAGGYQSNGENGHGSDYCITASDGYRAIVSIDEAIRDAMDGWMNSPGHRRNILDRWHKKVNIGLAWDRYNIAAAQHFEGDYVEYNDLPVIEIGVLTISGKAKHGVTFEEESDLGVQIYFDPPPHGLTRGQASRTYCYNYGNQVAGLRPPLRGNWYYPENDFTRVHRPCPNPYDVPVYAPPARSHNEAHEFWQAAYDASQAREEELITVPWITADEWTISEFEIQNNQWVEMKGVFSVKADLSHILTKHGEGVYSLIVWGSIGDERLVISEYSIFHGITPPDTYNFAVTQVEE